MIMWVYILYYQVSGVVCLESLTFSLSLILCFVFNLGESLVVSECDVLHTNEMQ
jgi:hypothetical protein